MTPTDRKGSGFSNFFGRKGSSTGSSTPVSPAISRDPVRFSVDARLPNPAILTCGQEVPVRILIKQLSERDEPLYLQTLQIELVGSTKVRAHEAFRTENTSWVLASLSNLNHEIGSRADDVNTETELTKEFWYGHPLPNTVAPSFVTCNLTRTYELVVSVGLSYGSNKQPLRVRIPSPLPSHPNHANPKPGSLRRATPPHPSRSLLGHQATRSSAPAHGIGPNTTSPQPNRYGVIISRANIAASRPTTGWTLSTTPPDHQPRTTGLRRTTAEL
jgi:hypothetical protein